MTRLAKLLVIFVAVASLGFAAFAAAMVSGGPNWTALGDHPGVAEKVGIAKNESAGNITYVGTHRLTGEQVGSSAILADVVLKAQKRVMDEMRTELQDIQGRITALTPQRDAAKQLVVTDVAGLEKHGALWSAQLQTMATRITQTTDELTQAGGQALQLQAELKELRFEVLRLRNQLELLRDDTFAAAEQQRALEAELLILQQNRQRLERRQEILKSQMAGTSYEAPVSTATSVP
jgi:hypothetical protein